MGRDMIRIFFSAWLEQMHRNNKNEDIDRKEWADAGTVFYE